MTTTANPNPPPDPNPLPPPPITAPPEVVIAPPALPPAPPDPELDDDDRRDGVQSGATIRGLDTPAVAVPRAAFKLLKERAAARGRTEAERDILASLGVESLDAARELVRQSKEKIMPDPVVPPVTPPVAVVVPAPAPAPVVVAPAPAPPAVAPAPAPVPPPAAPAPDDRAIPENTRRMLREQREAAERTAASEKARADAAVLETARVLKEREIREGMIADGVADIDYVFVQLQKHLKTIENDAAALAAFDRAAWTVKLKAEKPYLFRGVIAPANNGPTTPAPGTPPTPGAVTGAAAGAGAVDVRKMTDAERAAHYKGTGINFPRGSRNRPRT